MFLDALRESCMHVSVGGVLETEHGLQEIEKEREGGGSSGVKKV